MTDHQDLRKLLIECVDGLEAEADAGWSPDAWSHLRKLRAYLNMHGSRISAAPADQWRRVEDGLPDIGQTVFVVGQQPWEKERCISIDTWDEQHESPVSFSSATIPIGPGWNEHENFESVTHWMPLPSLPESDK